MMTFLDWIIRCWCLGVIALVLWIVYCAWRGGPRKGDRIDVALVRSLDMPLDYYLVDTAPVLYDQDPVLLGEVQQ